MQSSNKVRPIKSQPKAKSSNKGTWLQLACFVFMYFGFWQLGRPHYTFGQGWLWAGFGLIGLLLSRLLIKLLKRYSPDFLSRRNFPKLPFWISLSVSFAFGIPGLANLINHQFPIGSPECQQYLVTKKEKQTGRSKQYFVFVTIEGDSRSLRCSKMKWESLTEGVAIPLCIQKGGLGFKFIEYLE